MKLHDLRREYQKHDLDLKDVYSNPIEQFNKWFHEAQKAEVDEVNAMFLATVNENLKPSIRTVLLKETNSEGFIFFTNYLSQKGKDIEQNPQISILFFWKELERQIRIEGIASKISEGDSTQYFDSRPEESRVGAMASPQSQRINDRNSILSKIEEIKKKGLPIQRPDYWGGYILKPIRFEFWQGRPSRLHDRIVYESSGNNWELFRIAP